MGFRCGIIGLPNVGKSTLFNALTATAAAETANFPFCTIEPNIGKVPVPDQRLSQISKITNSKKTVSTQIEFVDIAGLVKGASKGEGLGNQFLSNIREVDAIVHVLRCFDDENISHVSGDIDPVNDMEIVETELMLSDLDSLERRIGPLEKKSRGNDNDAIKEIELIMSVLEVLKRGDPARTSKALNADEKIFKSLNLLSAKPVVYVCNVEEEAAVDGNLKSSSVANLVSKKGTDSVVISGKIESEVSFLSEENEKLEYLESIGLAEPGLSRVIRAGYSLLELITFFTTGPSETRAWTIPSGAKSPEAAGAIHSDFERGFIKAETISFDDFIKFNGEHGAKEAGKMRQEGKEYEVSDGDVMHFKFNV